MIFDKNEIEKYSGKINRLLDIIEKSEGPIFVFTQYNVAGALPIALALEQNG